MQRVNEIAICRTKLYTNIYRICLVQSSPIDSEEERAYQMFIEFIDHIEGEVDCALYCIINFNYFSVCRTQYG